MTEFDSSILIDLTGRSQLDSPHCFRAGGALDGHLSRRRVFKAFQQPAEHEVPSRSIRAYPVNAQTYQGL